MIEEVLMLRGALHHEGKVRNHMPLAGVVQAVLSLEQALQLELEHACVSVVAS